MLPEKFTSLGKKFPFPFLEKELRVSVFHEIGVDTKCTGSKEALCRKNYLIFNSSSKFKKKSAMLYVCAKQFCMLKQMIWVSRIFLL